jgi:hypothetical protein
MQRDRWQVQGLTKGCRDEVVSFGFKSIGSGTL